MENYLEGYKLLIGSINYRSISIFKVKNRSTFKKTDGQLIARLFVLNNSD